MVGYEDALDLLSHHNNNARRKYPLIAEWYGEDYNPEHLSINWLTLASQYRSKINTMELRSYRGDPLVYELSKNIIYFY
jgi:hypothetical protein